MKLNFLIPILLLGFSCQKGSEASKKIPQELRMNLHGEPLCLDPRKANDVTSINVLGACFEGLMRLGEDRSLAFGVAKEVKVSEDLKTYIFSLRNATWSDGVPITAFDFMDSWLSILDPSFASEFAHELFIIKNAKAYREGKATKEEIGIKAIDNQTLEVQLEYPIPYFLDLVSIGYFYPVPSHIAKSNPLWAKKYSKDFVGNGPFKLAEWQHYNEITLIKNEAYWDKDKVKLQKIYLPIIQDVSTELSMYENGELDWAGAPFSSLPLDAIPTIIKKHTLETFPVAGVYYYVFNVQKHPFNNRHLRMAFALAIQRQTIIDNILQGKQEPALWFVPPVLWKEKRENSTFKDGDLIEAKKLFNLALKEMGKTKETLEPITLSYNTSEGHHKIAQAIQQQWKEAFGIDVKLENKEWKVFLDELNKHEFQVARLGGIASYNDPMSFLDEGVSSRSLWTNKAYTKLIEKAAITSDPKRREYDLKNAEDLLIEDMPYAPIYFYTYSYLKKPYVKGVKISNTGHFEFKYTYLETHD